MNCYSTKLLFDWTVTLLNCYWTLRLLKKCYLIERLLDWTFIELLFCCTVTWLSCYLTELLFYWSVTWPSCYKESLCKALPSFILCNTCTGQHTLQYLQYQTQQTNLDFASAWMPVFRRGLRYSPFPSPPLWNKMLQAFLPSFWRHLRRVWGLLAHGSMPADHRREKSQLGNYLLHEVPSILRGWPTCSVLQWHYAGWCGEICGHDPFLWRRMGWLSLGQTKGKTWWHCSLPALEGDVMCSPCCCEMMCCHAKVQCGRLPWNEIIKGIDCVVRDPTGRCCGCGWCWSVLWCFDVFPAPAMLILAVSQVSGKQYFDCPQSHGLFMRAKVGHESTKFAFNFQCAAGDDLLISPRFCCQKIFWKCLRMNLRSGWAANLHVHTKWLDIGTLGAKANGRITAAPTTGSDWQRLGLDLGSESLVSCASNVLQYLFYVNFIQFSYLFCR